MLYESMFLLKVGNKRCFYLHDFPCTQTALLIRVFCFISVGLTQQSLEVRDWVL